MVFEADEDPDEEWNWLRGEAGTQYSEIAKRGLEYAQSWKENVPEVYYSWEWTPDEPEDVSE